MNRGKSKEKFSFVEASAYERGRKISDGHWRCNICGKPAAEEHMAEECHRCSDWNGCGGDCTLSRVYCEKCGKEKVVKEAVKK